jgi:hypothetical protein
MDPACLRADYNACPLDGKLTFSRVNQSRAIGYKSPVDICGSLRGGDGVLLRGIA